MIHISKDYKNNTVKIVHEQNIIDPSSNRVPILENEEDEDINNLP